MKKVLGTILIVLGILGFVVSNVSFTTTEQVADVGPVEIEKQEEQSIPVGPIASGSAVVIGIALVGFGARNGSNNS